MSLDRPLVFVLALTSLALACDSGAAEPTPALAENKRAEAKSDAPAKRPALEAKHQAEAKASAPADAKPEPTPSAGAQ